VLLRCAIHAGRRDRSDRSDEETLELVHEQLRDIMKIHCAPVFGKVYRLRYSTPQLLVGHVRRLKELRATLQRHSRLILAGSYWGGIGVPDCIRTGQETAQRIINELTSDPGASRG
jgi:oxygen-dependent protoporphyrinogen oxidase